MGGMESGIQYWLGKKTTTEECRSLDVNELARDSVFRVGSKGVLYWWSVGETGTPSASIRFRVLCNHNQRFFQIHYRWNDTGNVSQSILLQTTRPNFGGIRWWFECPHVVRGDPCARRVGKLYLKNRFFACRNCHDLTYRSCQQSHRVKQLARRITERGLAQHRS